MFYVQNGATEAHKKLPNLQEAEFSMDDVRKTSQRCEFAVLRAVMDSALFQALLNWAGEAEEDMHVAADANFNVEPTTH